MKFVLDTNVLLYYVREEATRDFLEETYGVFNEENDPYISIVSVAEILVVAEKSGWGSRKALLLQELLDDVIVVDIDSQELIDRCVSIELFSLNIHPNRARTGSAIKLGKNDLWIAATAAVIGATLLTSDNDFNHLHGEFIDIATYRRQ